MSDKAYDRQFIGGPLDGRRDSENHLAPVAVAYSGTTLAVYVLSSVDGSDVTYKFDHFEPEPT